MSSNPSPGAAGGAVRTLLRLEGLAVLAAAVFMYANGGHSWVLFAGLFLVPDVSFAGYLAGPRAGAAAYNALHTYIGPLLAGVVLVTAGYTPAPALVWAAHLGFDRALGYGLKYPSGFTHSHLGMLGRRPSDR